jgi:hypothetical protein
MKQPKATPELLEKIKRVWLSCETIAQLHTAYIYQKIALDKRKWTCVLLDELIDFINNNVAQIKAKVEAHESYLSKAK